MKTIIRIFFALLMLAFLSPVIASYFQLTTGSVFIGLVSLSIVKSFVPSPTGALQMAVTVEIWQNAIVKKLFKDNKWLDYMVNADEFVLAGKVVHIPQAGSNPNVVKNRSTFPAVVTKRTDTDITYQIAEFTTDPERIQNAEKYELSYDKTEYVLENHYQTLFDTACDNVLIDLAPETNIIRTTGAAVATHLDGTTGNRKKFVKEDLKKARALMNKRNIPKADRYAMIPSDMYEQLTEDADLLKRDSAGELNLPEGVVGKLYGFYLLERSSVLTYTGTNPSVNPYGALPNVDDCDAVLCWQKLSAERAKGDAEFFEDKSSPVYYGDVYSALLRISGRIRYDDESGMVAIVQDLSA